MPMLVLVNPNAGSVEDGLPLARWAESRGHVLVETRDADDARERAREAAIAGDAVVAAGGDGSVQAVVDGLLASAAETPRLGLIPLGTGNDLARSLCIPAELEAALEVLEVGHVEPLDVLEVVHEGQGRWCTNVATAGFSGELAEYVDGPLKARWGPLAYLWGGLAAVIDELEPFQLEATLDGQPLACPAALNVVIGNGRYAAGGFDLLPDARPDDGQLDVAIVPFNQSWVAQAELGARLLTGALTEVPGVITARGAELVLRAARPLAINLDGEPIGKGELTVRVLPRALQVLRPPPVTGVAE